MNRGGQGFQLVDLCLKAKYLGVKPSTLKMKRNKTVYVYCSKKYNLEVFGSYQFVTKTFGD